MTNVLDHATSDQHKTVMFYLHTAHVKANNQPITSYSPVARCLLAIQVPERVRIRCKFDLCYMMAKEGIAFEKYPALALRELEAQHNVDIGHAYKTAPAVKLFAHYIAQAQLQQFLEALSKKHFYSFLMDGSTDAGKVEQELVFLFLSCNKDDAVGEMKSIARYFSVSTPTKADASGLVECLGDSLTSLGITDFLDQKST